MLALLGTRLTLVSLFLNAHQTTCSSEQHRLGLRLQCFGLLVCAHSSRSSLGSSSSGASSSVAGSGAGSSSLMPKKDFICARGSPSGFSMSGNRSEVATRRARQSGVSSWTSRVAVRPAADVMKASCEGRVHPSRTLASSPHRSCASQLHAGCSPQVVRQP